MGQAVTFLAINNLPRSDNSAREADCQRSKNDRGPEITANWLYLWSIIPQFNSYEVGANSADRNQRLLRLCVFGRISKRSEMFPR